MTRAARADVTVRSPREHGFRSTLGLDDTGTEVIDAHGGSLSRLPKQSKRPD